MPRTRLERLEALGANLCCTKFRAPTIFPDGSLSACFYGRGMSRGNLARDEFIPSWNTAVQVVMSSGKCGCNALHVDADRASPTVGRCRARLLVSQERASLSS